MLPVYNLVVDIIAENTSISEKEFRELISPCLTYLDALKGAFDKKTLRRNVLSTRPSE
jgi:hypothetical protein